MTFFSMSILLLPSISRKSSLKRSYTVRLLFSDAFLKLTGRSSDIFFQKKKDKHYDNIIKYRTKKKIELIIRKKNTED